METKQGMVKGIYDKKKDGSPCVTSAGKEYRTVTVEIDGETKYFNDFFNKFNGCKQGDMVNVGYEVNEQGFTNLKSVSKLGGESAAVEPGVVQQPSTSNIGTPSNFINRQALGLACHLAQRVISSENGDNDLFSLAEYKKLVKDFYKANEEIAKELENPEPEVPEEVIM